MSMSSRGSSWSRGEISQFAAADRRVVAGGTGGGGESLGAWVGAASRRGRSSEAEAVGGWEQSVPRRRVLGFSVRDLR